MDRPPNEPKWAGPYLRKAVPLDPWEKPYVYKMPGEKGDFDLLSFGKDGQPGGSGEAADIANAVVFLASDQAAWISGQILSVDGGRS